MRREILQSAFSQKSLHTRGTPCICARMPKVAQCQGAPHTKRCLSLQQSGATIRLDGRDGKHKVGTNHKRQQLHFFFSSQAVRPS